MKQLLRISFLTLFVSCASFPKKHNFTTTATSGNIQNLYFADQEQDYIYKANIEVYDNTFGGIFIVKKLGQENHRVAFTTEMGYKLFDFSFNKEAFTVNYILDDLNKKILINILKKDFKTLITENIYSTKTYNSENEVVKESALDSKTYYYLKSKRISKIIRTNGRKEKVRFLFSEISDNIAQQIEIKHSNIKLKINLKSIIK